MKLFLTKLAASQRARAEMKKIALYVLCGGTGVLTDVAVFTALVRAGLDYQIAVLAGCIAGPSVSFLLHRRFTFNVLDKTARRMTLFFAAAAVGYVSSAAIMWLLVDVLGFTLMPAKFISLCFVFVIQYSFNRLVTFKFKAA
jgi:putative flippase GtrA